MVTLTAERMSERVKIEAAEVRRLRQKIMALDYGEEFAATSDQLRRAKRRLMDAERAVRRGQ